MLRKRSVGNRISTFPAQALPWSGSTGIISASFPAADRNEAPRESEIFDYCQRPHKDKRKIFLNAVTKN